VTAADDFIVLRLQVSAVCLWSYITKLSNSKSDSLREKIYYLILLHFGMISYTPTIHQDQESRDSLDESLPASNYQEQCSENSTEQCSSCTSLNEPIVLASAHDSSWENITAQISGNEESPTDKDGIFSDPGSVVLSLSDDSYTEFLAAIADLPQDTSAQPEMLDLCLTQTNTQLILASETRGAKYSKSVRLECAFPNCTKTFSKKENMNRHMTTMHGFGITYPCRNLGCDVSDTRKDNRDRHEWKHCKFKPKTETGGATATQVKRYLNDVGYGNTDRSPKVLRRGDYEQERRF